MTQSKNTALILVDFENEWILKNSPYYVKDLQKVLQNTNKLIDECRRAGHKIIFISHVEKDSQGISQPFAQGTSRVEIIPALHKKPSDALITKYKISPFYQTSLEKELHGITHIIIAGILTNLCVRSLAHDAYDRDFQIIIIKDCCTAFDKKTHDFTLHDLKATREEIEIMDLKQFLKKTNNRKN